MTAVRAFAFALRLAWLRLAHRRAQALLAAAGVAFAAAAVGTVAAVGAVASERGLARAVSDLPPAGRAVRASWFGLGDEPYAGLDARVRRALGGRPVPAVLFRESTVGGAFVGIGGVAGVGRFVRVTSGRLPSPCRPPVCEVVLVRGSGPLPHAAGLRLVAVGRGVLVSGLPFGAALSAAPTASLERARRYHQPPQPPLVLAEGVAPLTQAAPLRATYRSYAWSVALGPGLHVGAAEHLGADVEHLRSTLQSASSSFEVGAPVEEVDAALARGRVAARRLLVLSGSAAALLLAFALLAALRMRANARAAWARLSRAGARVSENLTVVAAEVVAVTVAGTAAGWAAAAGIAALVARAADAPAGEVVSRSLASRGLLVAAGIAAAGSLVVAGAVASRPLRLRGLSFTPVDAIGLGAVAAIALALARGAADASSLEAGGGTGAVLLLLPALAALAAMVAVARVLPLLVRVLERIAPWRAVSLRVAALTLARGRGSAAVAAGFVAVSVGIAFFASTYRSTLARGQRDQAAYAVPVGAIVREDAAKLVPLDVAVTQERLAELRRSVHVDRVLRLAGSVSGVGGNDTTVLGIDARSLPRLRWRDDFAARPLPELARRIEPTRPVELRGPVIPEHAPTLTLDAKVSGAVPRLSVVVETTRGAFLGVDLVRGRAVLPASARGGRIVAIRLEPPPRLQERGANAGHAALGTLRLGPLRAGSHTLTRDYAGWRALGGATRTGLTTLRYSLSPQAITWFRPEQPFERTPLPVLASPRLAAAAGAGNLLPVGVAGERLLTRVVGVARRFPTTSGDFVVADAASLSAALNGSDPGSAAPTELWLAGGRVGALLARPPFDVLAVDSRRAREAELRRDPIARASLLVLGAIGIGALALCVVAVVLGTVSELRDEQAELFDLEAEGAPPRLLRRQLALRAAVVALVGLLGGAGLGAALSALVVSVVAVTAGGGAPVPPLVRSVDWTLVAFAAAAFALAAAAAVTLPARRAFAGSAPARPAEVDA